MFEWWDLEFSIIFFVVLIIAGTIARYLWSRFVNRYLRMKYHFWSLPLFAITGMVTGIIAAFFQQTRLTEVLIFGSLLTGFFLTFVVGAKCPDCEKRLKYRSSKYGPAQYDCGSCGYHWRGWGLRDKLP